MANTPVVESNSRSGGQQAAVNRELLSEAGVLAVYLSGNPGSGKTSLIEATLKRVAISSQVSVIVAHLAAERDAATLERAGAHVIALQNSPLQPAALHEVIGSMILSQRRMDMLLIENAGQLAEEPAPIGQVARVAVFSVSCGDTKAAEFPHRVSNADVVLITKVDLLPHVRFDMDVFRADVARINPKAKIIQLSSTQGDGMGEWIDWLLAKRLQSRPADSQSGATERSEWWVG